MKTLQKRDDTVSRIPAGQSSTKGVGRPAVYGNISQPAQLKKGVLQRVWFERVDGKITEKEDPRPPSKHKAFNGVMHNGAKITVWEPKGPPKKTNKEKMDSYPREGVFEVDSADVMFSQDSIKKNFTDGTSYETTIEKFRKDGKYVVSDTLKPIRVFEGKNDRLVSLDNRRLYCAKAAGIKIKCQFVSEEVVAKEIKKLSSGKGREGKSTIEVRG